MDKDTLALIAETFSAAMAQKSGAELDTALTELGWQDLLAEDSAAACKTVFRLMGEIGCHAPLINDVVLHSAGKPLGGVVTLPFTGGSWVRWERHAEASSDAIDPDIPLIQAEAGVRFPLADAHRALGWWLVGSSRAMLALAREHALDRTQFGKPIASFQAVRHRLAETFVAIEGAEAALRYAADDMGSLAAKAIAGQAALTSARHCQQVLGGIGFTAEHSYHRHYRRVLMLDALLGSNRQLTRALGARLRGAGRVDPLVQLN